MQVNLTSSSSSPRHHTLEQVAQGGLFIFIGHNEPKGLFIVMSIKMKEVGVQPLTGGYYVLKSPRTAVRRVISLSGTYILEGD